MTFPERSWRFGDGFYLTVLMPGEGEQSASHVSLGLARVGDRLEATVVNRSGEYFPRLSTDGLRLAMRPGPGERPELSSGVHAWPDGLVYELAVPWSLLAPADPLTLDSLAVNIVVVDRDTGRNRRFALLHPDPSFDTERTPLRSGRMIPLRRAAGSAPTRLAVRPAASILAAGSTSPVTVATRSAVGVAAPPAISLSLERDGRTVERWAVPLSERQGPVRRGVTDLRIPPGTGTGPAVLRAGLESGLEVVRPLFVVDPTELDSIAARLDRRTRTDDARAALPAILLRLERLAAAAVDPAANAPLDVPARWWSGIRELAVGLEASVPPSLRGPGAHEVAHRSRIDGTLQPYSVYLPAGIHTATARTYPLLVALHGSGVTERGTLRSVGPYAAERGWIVVAPRGRGLSDWWDGAAMTDVLEVIDHVQRLYPVDGSRVALAGFSMGGYGAWRLLLRHPDRFRKVAVLAGADCPPPSVEAPCVSAVLDGSMPPVATGSLPPVLVLHGVEDNAVPVAAARRLVDRLHMAGRPVEYREIEGAGHGSAGWWRQVVDWLADGSAGP